MDTSLASRSPVRNWKGKPYTIPLEMRVAPERANEAQPALISLHGKATAPLRKESDFSGERQ